MIEENIYNAWFRIFQLLSNTNEYNPLHCCIKVNRIFEDKNNPLELFFIEGLWVDSEKHTICYKNQYKEEAEDLSKSPSAIWYVYNYLFHLEKPNSMNEYELGDRVFAAIDGKIKKGMIVGINKELKKPSDVNPIVYNTMCNDIYRNHTNTAVVSYNVRFDLEGILDIGECEIFYDPIDCPEDRHSRVELFPNQEACEMYYMSKAI